MYFCRTTEPQELGIPAKLEHCSNRVKRVTRIYGRLSQGPSAALAIAEQSSYLCGKNTLRGLLLREVGRPDKKLAGDEGIIGIRAVRVWLRLYLRR